MTIIFNKGPRAGAALARGLCAATLLAVPISGLLGCSSKSDTTAGDAGGATATPYTETQLTLTLSLDTDPVVDAGSPSDAGGASADAGSADAGPPPPPATLTITATDGTTPVVTDLWLYTLDSSGNKTALTGFTSNKARKTPRLMLPATIGGKPSGLAPADDGRQNGVMTDTARGKLVNGQFVSTVTGKVIVSLPAVPTTPILVIAGVEDQRYAGGAVVNPDGSAGTVPAGEIVLETHTLRSFANEVAPILEAQCVSCHKPGGPDNADFYAVAGSADDLVNGNFALNEQTGDCKEANPDGGATYDSCVAAISKAQFLVEPGAPAVSDLLQRSRPDEDAGTSAQGLLWYGGKGQRYNATYGDRRMPSTTQSTNAADWTNDPIYFDLKPGDFQIVYDWVAQGAKP